jgi:predicted Zn-dependent peptidase
MNTIESKEDSMKTKTFKNGLVLLYEKNKECHVDAFHVNVLTGSALETSKQLGINHLVEHLMFKSSNKRTTQQISEELERQGAIINAWTNYDNVCFHFCCLPEKIDKCAEIYADMLFNKDISQSEFDKEKLVVCQEIAMYKDDYPATNDTNYFENFWGMGDVAGTTESVSGTTLKQVNNFIKRRYVPANMVISVCSKLSFRKVCSIVEKYFGSIDNPEDYVNLRDEWKSRRVFTRQNFGKPFIQKNKATQVQVLHAFYLPKQSPVLNDLYRMVLSSGLASILFREVREKYGLCYRIKAEDVMLLPNVFNNNQPDVLFVRSSMEKQHLKTYLEVLPEVFKRLPELLTSADLERVVNIKKTQETSSVDIALHNFFKYLNPEIYYLGKDLRSEEKHIFNNAEEYAKAGCEIMKNANYDVAILGNVNKI